MTDKIVKMTRKAPVEGIEGVVFRHPQFGPVEVVQVVNTRQPDQSWEAQLWLTPASPDKAEFLSGCEVDLETLAQSFATREDLTA